MPSIALYRDVFGLLYLIPLASSRVYRASESSSATFDGDCQALDEGRLEHQLETDLTAAEIRSDAVWIAIWRRPGYWWREPRIRLNSPSLGNIEAYLAVSGE